MYSTIDRCHVILLNDCYREVQQIFISAVSATHDKSQCISTVEILAWKINLVAAVFYIDVMRIVNGLYVVTLIQSLRLLGIIENLLGIRKRPSIYNESVTLLHQHLQRCFRLA